VGWVNRPLDVKYLLDELEQKSQSDPAWQGQMNLQQVGVIGHSLGGYTVLALAGAKPKFAQLRQKCNQIEPSQALNLAVMLQCRATDLPLANSNLQDPRVKAVLAINPVTSTIFGQEGLSQIQVPLMMVAGTEDYFTPPVPEQILPFTWLTTPNKYLVLTAGGTHFSFLGGEGQEALPSSELIGPDPALARPSMDALSTAFFKTHLANQPEYRPYLNQSYVSSISQSPFALSLVQSLKPAQSELARR
jgi:predicted dienelactone hydrolase